MPNNIFIISGPSGAGEDSVIKGLREIFPVEKVVTTTTRAIRSGEQHGVDYYFVSDEEFQQGIANNDFFEYAQEYNNKFYGVTKQEIERVMNLPDMIGIWKIEYKGVITAKRILPEVRSIMINAPEQDLIDRLKKRGDVSEEMLNERLEYNKEWLANKNIYDYIVNNADGKLNQTIEKVAEIIKKEANIKQ